MLCFRDIKYFHLGSHFTEKHIYFEHGEMLRLYLQCLFLDRCLSMLLNKGFLEKLIPMALICFWSIMC